MYPGNDDINSRYDEVCDKLFQLEKDLDLFSLKINDIYIWKRIRYKLRREILQNLGVRTSPTSESADDQSRLCTYLRFAFRGGENLPRSLLFNNPFLTTTKNFLFFGHERRKKQEDGYWWDIYCDPVTDRMDDEYLHLEKQHQHTHRKPAKTNNLKYSDLIYYADLLRRVLGLSNVPITSSEKQEIHKVEGIFESEFDVSVDLHNLIKKVLISHSFRKRMYGRIIDSVDPEIAVLVVSYANEKEYFIDACNEKGIPVVELQHGVIHETHQGYHFPDDVDARPFPDYILTFGKYWCDCVNYPIENDKVIPVGYPYLEMESEKYADVEERDQIIFVSQGVVGDEMSKFAVEASKSIDYYDIIYKLHPSEYDMWRNEYSWLESSDLRVVGGDGPPIYRLFAESKVQIGVHSTAIYEGLNFGLDTYLIEGPGTSVMESLIDMGVASVVSSVDELEGELRKNTGNNASNLDLDYFFKPNSLENISKAFDEIMGRES